MYNINMICDRGPNCPNLHCQFYHKCPTCSVGFFKVLNQGGGSVLRDHMIFCRRRPPPAPAVVPPPAPPPRPPAVVRDGGGGGGGGGTWAAWVQHCSHCNGGPAPCACLSGCPKPNGTKCTGRMATKECTACHADLPRARFSKKQWGSKMANKRRCRACINKGTGGPALYVPPLRDRIYVLNCHGWGGSTGVKRIPQGGTICVTTQDGNACRTQSEESMCDMATPYYCWQAPTSRKGGPQQRLGPGQTYPNYTISGHTAAGQSYRADEMMLTLCGSQHLDGHKYRLLADLTEAGRWTLKRCVDMVKHDAGDAQWCLVVNCCRGSTHDAYERKDKKCREIKCADTAAGDAKCRRNGCTRCARRGRCTMKELHGGRRKYRKNTKRKKHRKSRKKTKHRKTRRLKRILRKTFKKKYF